MSHTNAAFDGGDGAGQHEPAGLEMTPPTTHQKRLCVLGTGDFGRAITRRAVAAGFSVTLGTRSKEKQTELMRLIDATGATVAAQADAIASADLVVVAVPRRFYQQLPLPLLADKILIDVSNRDDALTHKSVLSNAEYLQELVPSAQVVKALNVLSAYLLETGGIQGNKEVPVASDSGSARARVVELVRDLGFSTADMGPLRHARHIEAIPLQFFNEWRSAVAVVASMFLVGYVLNFINWRGASFGAIYPDFVAAKLEELQIGHDVNSTMARFTEVFGRHCLLCHNLTENEVWDWSVFKQILMTNFNRNLGVTALATLGAVYLAGVIAGFLQLYRGTKYSRFPVWLDSWLRMRKQLGLLVLAMAAVHGCMSLGIYHPHHQYDWLFDPPTIIRAEVKVNETFTQLQDVQIWFHRPNWRGEVFLTLGAVTLFLLGVLGITSLPSVTGRLTWREFSFVQSKLGWTALVAGALHDTVLGWDYMLTAYDCFYPNGLQYTLYLPLLCVVGKLILLLPPVGRRLADIRSGVVHPPASQA